jgi:hypothetical protein
MISEPKKTQSNPERERMRASRGEGQRRPYKKPTIRCLGDIRDITFGASGGLGDSGQELTHGFL